MTLELQAIVKRLEEVEKEVARLTALVVEKSDTNRTIAARSFVVKDDSGQERAILELARTGPWLGLSGSDGKLRAGLSLIEGKGPWLELYDEKSSEVVVEIKADENGPRVALFDTNGKPNTSVFVSEHGPCIMLYSPKGKQCLSLEVLSGVPRLIMFDKNGEARLKLALDSDGPSLLFAKDNKVFWPAP